jgi:hypothetical protein
MTIAEWWQEISEIDCVEIVGKFPGVWAFGATQMCFALLPKEAKIRVYEVFTDKFCRCEPAKRTYWRQSADGQSLELVEERTL